MKSGKRATKWIIIFRWIPLLAPIKYLTVLYHEMCHAIVGFCTGGRPILIIVDWNQGGATFFAKDKQPNLRYALPAGYIGSCIIGCGFIFAGFDTVASKYAFIVFQAMALLSMIISFLVLPKSLIHHHRHWIIYKYHKFMGNFPQAKNRKLAHEEKAEQEKVESKWNGKKQEDSDASDKDKMVSIEL